MDAIRWIFSPNPDINYDVISMMYGFASVLCVALYLFERYLTGSIADSKLKDQGGEVRNSNSKLKHSLSC